MTDDLQRIAADAVPDVLAAALDRAREQAVVRLADLLTDAIVTQALAGGATAMTPPARPVEPDAGPRPADLSGEAPAEALYAYGITTAGLRLPDDARALTDGAPLERVGLGDLELLVSPVRRDQLRIDEDDLSESGRLATLARGHDAVVRAAAGSGPVLPLRFGTVVADEAAARRLLQEHGESAREQLRRIADTREWGVRLVRSLDAEPAPVGPRSGERSGVTGTEYLARRRRALAQHGEAEAAAEKAADVLQETLRPHVTESLRRGGAMGSSLLLDLAYLVRPDAEADFLAAAAELGERFAPEGFGVEVSGPWPPYSFVSLGDGDA